MPQEQSTRASILCVALALVGACGPAPTAPPPAPVVELPAPPPPPPPPPPVRPGPLCTFHGVCWSGPSPQGNALHGVVTLGPNLVLMVGDRGTVLRYDGVGFALEDTPLRERLRDVWGDGPARVFAVGDRGTILRRGADGAWTADESGSTASLHAVWGRGGEAWAVGDAGTILHLAAGGWVPEPSGTDRALVDVWGTATGVYALAVSPDDAGDAEATVLSRSESGWTTLSTLAGDLGGLFVDAAGQFALVGADGRHGDGTRWSRETLAGDRPLDAVWGAEGVIFAGGYEGRIARYDGTSWALEAIDTTLDVHAISGTSASDVWAVGEHGLVAHLLGSEWTVVSSGPTSNLEAVFGLAPDDVWAVGHEISLHWDGVSWSAAGPADVELEAMSGAGGELVAVGSDGAVRRFAGGAWAIEASGTTSKLEGVWSDRAGHAFAVGGGTFLERVGLAWTAVPDRPPATAVWGSAASDVWAVGPDGAQHYDGSAWIASPSSAGHALFGVWGSAANDVWAVGAGGVILHFDGTAWAPVASHTSQDLVGVWGSGASDVWAVGRHGTLLRFDGAEWRWRDSGTDELLHSVWGTGPRDVWIVGHGGVVLHYGG